MRPAGMDPIVTSKKTMGFFGLGGLRCHSTATVGVAAAAAAATTTLLLLLFVAAPPEAIAARERGRYTREDESGREKRAGGTTQMTVLEDGWRHNPKLGLCLTWARLGQLGRPIAVALGNHVLGCGLTWARVANLVGGPIAIAFGNLELGSSSTCTWVDQIGGSIEIPLDNTWIGFNLGWVSQFGWKSFAIALGNPKLGLGSP